MTDDKAALREQLEPVTGERIAALEAADTELLKWRESGLDSVRRPGLESDASESQVRDRVPEPAMESRAPKGRDFGL